MKSKAVCQSRNRVPPQSARLFCVWKRFQSFHVSFKFLSFKCAVISLKNETPLRDYASLYGSYGVMAQSFRDSLRKGKQKNDRQVKKKRMESKIYLEKNEQHAKGWTYIWSYSSTPFALFLPSSYSHDLINQDDGGIAPCVYATPPPSSSPFPISVSFP